MRFEIVVATHPRASTGLDPEPAHASRLTGAQPDTVRPRHAALQLVPPEPRRRHVPGSAGAWSIQGDSCELLDVFVDGTNVTSGIRETHGAFVLRDLALTLLALARHPRGKGTVRFYDEPWELCVERFGSTACLSLYLAGADPQVTMYDRPVPFDEVVAAARTAIDGWLSGPFSSGGARLELASASAQLHALGSVADEAQPQPLPLVPPPPSPPPRAGFRRNRAR
jgi:hypothetical protein